MFRVTEKRVVMLQSFPSLRQAFISGLTIGILSYFPPGYGPLNPNLLSPFIRFL
jgi:hypothetical protein